MYVCICHDITDKDIKHAISSGHTDLNRIMQATSAGSCCGACIPFVNDFIDAHHALDASVALYVPKSR